jgi:hypothetical protein
VKVGQVEELADPGCRESDVAAEFGDRRETPAHQELVEPPRPSEVRLQARLPRTALRSRRRRVVASERSEVPRPLLGAVEGRQLPQVHLARHLPRPVRTLEVGHHLGRQLQEQQELADPCGGHALLASGVGRTAAGFGVDPLLDAPGPPQRGQDAAERSVRRVRPAWRDSLARFRSAWLDSGFSAIFGLPGVARFGVRVGRLHGGQRHGGRARLPDRDGGGARFTEGRARRQVHRHGPRGEDLGPAGRSPTVGQVRNGDGFDDLVLGSAGGLRWFRGGPGGYAAEPAWSVTGPDDGWFAASVTGADVDGDGFGDVVAGTRQGPRAWYGSAAGLPPDPSWGWSGDGAQDPGRGVAGLGDVNGDGFDDLAVASVGASTPAARASPVELPPDPRPPASAVGRVVVFLGSPAGLGAEPVWVMEGAVAHERLGSAIAALGDGNGDGFDDVALGAPGFTPGGGWTQGLRATPEGAVAVFAGGPQGLGREPLAWVPGPPGAGAFGAAVAGAGDVDGDGRAEWLAGAPGSGDDDPARAVFLFGDDPVGGPAAPAALFAPPATPLAPPAPWRDNVVLRDWVYECPAPDLHAWVGRTLPRGRSPWGRDLGRFRETCAEGSREVVGPDEAPPGALSPRAAVAAWSAGVVWAGWCGDLLPDGPLATAARLDPEVAAEWWFEGWSDAPDREIVDCPWRRVLRVPVVLTLRWAGAAPEVPAWLLVTSDDPRTWTLTTRGEATVAVPAAVARAWGAEVALAATLRFQTDGLWGHRQLQLAVRPVGAHTGRQDPTRWVDGEWGWGEP